MRKFAFHSIIVFAFIFCFCQSDVISAQATLEKPRQDSKQSEDSDKNEAQKKDSDQESDKGDKQEKDGDQKQEKDKKAKDDSSDKKQSEDKKAESNNRRRSSGRTGAFGMSWGSQNVSKRDPSFIKVFEPVAASMDGATVRIMVDKTQVALGAVVDSSGLILTKASELRPGMQCLIGELKLTPTVVGIHPETDLALLRVDAKSLNVIQWSDQPTPVLGKWVASPKAESKQKPAIGIIATENSRAIPRSSPFIGIKMESIKAGIKITEIVPKSPAENAGLEADDVIYQIDGNSVMTNEELINEIGQYDVGDRISLSILRSSIKRTIKLNLVERDKVAEESQRSNQQNSMGSRLSRRRKDFPKAFQHDSMLNANTCGGPIIDLSGKVIGINIARDGRVSSLALPVEIVLPIIELLKTGDLSPIVVNKKKIESLEAELIEVAKTIGQLPAKKNVLNVRYSRERARLEELTKFSSDYKSRVEELEKMMADYKGKLSEYEERRKEVQRTTKNIKKELDSVHSDLRNRKKVETQLKKDLERLKTGSSS